ncbi:MAG TPA: Mur ligase family protein, partial [Rectinemataceae bacterium]|nr:Mur ligase family protein [Rectinemataceae bacterium]
MSVLPSSIRDIAGMKVLVMGLGLHGGGLESARFFCDKGAIVTVTDLRDETTLKPSIEALEGRALRYVLGKHEIEDFRTADIVIKNPAVRRTSPYLAAAKAIETDVSVFLRYSKSPIVAVTGSKGKSSTASAIHHGFRHSGTDSLLGGNITVSPLSFLDETGADRPVVLELSSWQLADMRGLGVLKPKVAVLTAIMPDHMNYYSSMEEYVADKRLIYA